MRVLPPHPHYIPFGHLIDLDEFLVQLLLLDLLAVPRVHLGESQILNLLLPHQAMLHPALDVVNLELLATLRHQLVLVQARVVPHGMLLTLVEVVQGERALVWP